ncbi:hypothetical protein [Bacillus marinisedimentorum]|uniref:hypothetical protein n=1 Tax=Bacillus marinisedimentorum TaxID=1821260 RepID=UPI001FDFD8A4|nr:hypothetical protein [Bacillus marinisedimentorum]
MQQYGNWNRADMQMSPEQMHDFCSTYKDHYVQMETSEGQQAEGIIYKVDRQHVYLMVPVGDMGDDREAGYGYGLGGYGFPGYGFPGYGFPGYGFGYGYPRRFRRFRRYRYPFFGIRRFFFPFFF